MQRPTLEVTTMIGCPLMCNFCPQDNLRDSYGKESPKYMSLDTFKTVIDKLPQNCRIDFSGMAEPWVNPECTAMLEYSLTSGRNVAIYTTLYNWTEETASDVLALFNRYRNQIEVFSIHFPDEYGNMKGWKYSKEWEQVFRTMSTGVQQLRIKLEAMTMSDHGKIHQDLQHLGIQLYNWFGHDRAGSLNKEQVKEQPINFITRHEKPIICSKTVNYDQHVLLPNGDIVLCCMDYDTKHILGNMISQSYEDMFTGQGMVDLIKENVKNCYSDKSLCKSCTDALVVDIS
ncbi:4Fe4S-binding SPASM domain containing protein [uncultured Caudovirales phage]|uniref:4Fe4S-binding SPASM domain containing protein n=1 Tax=uncultured Caudovirales phage TaxID=2100421 RepID=A0A6J5LEQ6_9CAUD|nr:4Fe4S-binding SPASM domain containing protein [uncultured Caudovirales phage]